MIRKSGEEPPRYPQHPQDDSWDERFSGQIAASVAKREQRREIRAELAAARKIGKAKYHRFRLTVAGHHHERSAVILPPLAEWRRPTWRRFLEREGYGNHLAARIRAGAGWWAADDVLRDVGNAAGRASTNNYRPIDRDKLDAVIEALGDRADRLIVREFIQPKEIQK